MIHQFETFLLDKDGTYRTQTINGATGILVRAEKSIYSYEEIISVLGAAFFRERLQYGWNVKFNDDEQKKYLFLRASGIEKCNATTRENESIYDWIDYLYDRDVKQLGLF